MKIIVNAEELSGIAGTPPKKVEITFAEIGSQGWVRISIGGTDYEIDYREFWDAARSTCIAVY